MGDTISMQKCGKASGPANIHMEAFIHGGHRLQLLLSCLLWPPYVIGEPLYFCPVVSFLLPSSIFFFFLA